MGIGTALYEEMIFKNGNCVNSSFQDYKMPRARDLPRSSDIKVSIVETRHKEGPYGAKGVGEATMVCTASAIANAIYDAIGVRMKKMPMTSEDLVQALKR